MGVLVSKFQEKRKARDMEAQSFSSSIANFAARFCNELDKSKSVVSSPLSAEFVLALLALGTTDPAHEELLTSLGIPDDETIRSLFSAVSSRMKSIKGVTLNVANKVYVMDGPHELETQMKQDAVNVFDAGIETMNFSDGAAAAAKINKWVESKTNNRIKELLSSDCLGDDTRLVLVNALYFKGTWEKQFDPHYTSDQPFHIDTKNTVEVPMMYKETEFNYGESKELNAQLLQLPYKGGEASMVIVLPQKIDGLNQVLQKLAKGHDLIAELDTMSSIKVQTTIPKFKIETEIDLAVLLPKLGIKTIFNASTQCLSNILNTNEPLYVSKAVQKAFIEVNEEGAEAAAATGMVMMLRSAMDPPSFHADRPFLYTLTGPNRSTLFVGVYRA